MTLPTYQLVLTKAQVKAWEKADAGDWFSYYDNNSDNGVPNESFLEDGEYTLEQGTYEVAAAAASGLKDNVLTLVAGSASEGDVQHMLEMSITGLEVHIHGAGHVRAVNNLLEAIADASEQTLATLPVAV